MNSRCGPNSLQEEYIVRATSSIEVRGTEATHGSITQTNNVVKCQERQVNLLSRSGNAPELWSLPHIVVQIPTGNNYSGRILHLLAKRTIDQESNLD